MNAITASTTDRSFAARLEGAWSYHVAVFIGETYTIESAPAFDLELERSGSTWVVRDRETGIFGSGPTPSEALVDFQAAAREHRDVLERQDALTDELAEQLKYLRARAS